MKKCLIIALLLFISFSLSAHPHLYINMNIELEIDEYGFKGFWQEWTILRNFGEKIVEDYDRDSNGRFDTEESGLIEQEVFSNIKKYKYFTHIVIDDQVYYPEAISNFQVENLNGRARYRFFIPCRIPAGERTRYFDILVFDETLYTSFGLNNLGDPSHPAIEYDVTILRNGNIYSHSNNLGNAVIEVAMKKTISGKDRVFLEETAMDYLIQADPEKEIRVSTGNPFVSFGINLGDGTGNPFF